jgi:acyl carrier protein
VTQQDTAVAPIDSALREQVVESICATLPRVLKREVTGITEDTTLMDRNHFDTVGTLADYVAGNLLPE